jgi:hypothetical protein
MNFPSFKWDLDFIHDILHENASYAALGGLAAIGFGYLLGMPSMIIVGAIVLLVVAVDYILYRIGSRG